MNLLGVEVVRGREILGTLLGIGCLPGSGVMAVFVPVRIALWYLKHKSRYLAMASSSTFSLAVKV